MTVKELSEEINGKILTNSEINTEILNAFVGDLLSVVIGKAKEGCAWITIQSHINIVAVAELVDMSVIVVCEGYVLDDDALERANAEGLSIISTELSEYDVCKKLVKAGIK